MLDKLKELLSPINSLFRGLFSSRQDPSEEGLSMPELPEVGEDEAEEETIETPELPSSFVGPSEEYKQDLQRRHDERMRQRQSQAQRTQEFVFEGESPTEMEPAELPPEPSSESTSTEEASSEAPELPRVIDPPGHGAPRISSRDDPYGAKIDMEKGFVRDSERDIFRQNLDSDDERFTWQHAHNQTSNAVHLRTAQDLADDYRSLEQLRTHLEYSRTSLEDTLL